MPQMENKAVSGEKGSPPQNESGSGDMKIADLFWMLCERMDSHFEIRDKKFEALQEDWRSMNQRFTHLEHDARQPSLAMEADRPANTKTRERREGATTTVQAKRGIAVLHKGVKTDRRSRPVSA